VYLVTKATMLRVKGDASACGSTVEVLDLVDDPRCSPPERSALLSLFEATGGRDWRKNAGWVEAAQGQESNDPCVDHWDGVQCRDGHVITLRLDNSRLRGTIPPNLGALTELAVLDLSLNQLSGTLPSQLGDLEKLQQLELKVNGLEGTLPAALHMCSMLECVSIARNGLGGSIPEEWAALGRLRRLFASHNSLAGGGGGRGLCEGLARSNKAWAAGHPQIDFQSRPSVQP
jgi:hypothetical protein